MYENDFSKHTNTNQLPRIRMVWNSIHLETIGNITDEAVKYKRASIRIK
jgi:hypothetical protein